MRTRIGLVTLGGLLAAYLVVPVGGFLIRVAGSHKGLFTTSGLWSALGVSLEASTISLALMTVLGVPLAHALARSHGRLASAVGVAVQLPLAIPPIMGGVLLIYIIGPYSWIGAHIDRTLTQSLGGVVIAQTFVSAPFLVVAARTGFESVDPNLGELAATCGHGSFSRFWQIDLRGALPQIRAGMILAWLRAFGEYGAVVIVAYHPFSLPVYTETQFSGAGLPSTEGPTLLALVVAGAAIYLSRARWRRPRPSATVPAPAAPAPAEPVPISFEIDTTVGTFRLRLTHHASSHRLAIVGPSGSGKTLALRTLAGLGPSGGQVRYGPDDVTAEPPEQRRIGYVPQGSGLLPARTVWEQVMFAVDADPARAAWWVDTLHIADLADRLPPQISGGQAQRTSLARALSRDPEIVFLDEPFSALDTPVRHELRQELHRLQQQVGLSTVLVTHDPEEAAMLADEIVVIADGRVLQAGTCTDVFRRPASTEIARLLDIENVREGTTVAGGLVDASQTDQPDHTLIRAVTDLPAGTAVMWSVHPHDVALGGDGGYPAVVHDVVRQGTLCKLTLEFGPGLHLSAWSTAEEPPQIGESIRADVPPPAVTVWVPEKAASVLSPSAGD